MLPPNAVLKLGVRQPNTLGRGPITPRQMGYATQTYSVSLSVTSYPGPFSYDFSQEFGGPGTSQAYSQVWMIGRGLAASSAAPQTSSLQRQTGARRGVGKPAIAFLLRAVGAAGHAATTDIAGSVQRPTKLLAAFVTQGQASTLLRQAVKRLGGASSEAYSVLRANAITRSTATVQAVGRSLQSARRLAVAAGEASVVVTPKVVAGQAYSITSAEIARVARSVGHSVALASGEAAHIARTLAKLLTYAAAAPASTTRLTNHLARATLAQVVVVFNGGRIVTRLLSVTSSPGPFSSDFSREFGGPGTSQSFGFGHANMMVATAMSANAALLAKGLPATLSVASTSFSSIIDWLHRFVPVSLRRRVVRLPPASDISTLPRALRRIVLPDARQMSLLPPAIRRVVLPPEVETMSDFQIHNPEPAFFSAFDPSDEDTFTFDWSRRGYTGDTIVFASVVSVPSGVNFLGPAFIDGQAVEITVGPFPQTASTMPLPATFLLRCMAVFRSGRISNYSVPFEVRTL